MAAKKEGTKAPAKSEAPRSVQEMDDAYEILVEDSVKAVHQYTTVQLKFYYVIGRAAAQLLNSPNKYGSRTVKKYAEDISRRSGRELAESSITKAVQFATNLTSAQRTKCIKLNLSWRQAHALSHGRLTEAQRDHALAEVDTGRLAPTEVLDYVRKTSPTAKPKKKGQSPKDAVLKRLKGAPNLVHMVSEKLRGIGEEAVAIFRGDDVQAMKEAAAMVGSIEDETRDLALVIKHELEPARQEMDKVKEVIQGDA